MVSNNRLPIDRGWAWVIVVASFINIFFMVGLAKSFGILVEQFIKKFEVSTAVATMVMSVSAIVYAIMAPISIIIGQRVTARVVVMTGGCLALIGISISSLLLSMGFVIGFLGIGFGIGNSAIYGNSMVMIGTYFKERRTLANGLALAGASIGQFSLPPLIQFLLETYNLNGTLLLLAALYFHVTLFGSLLRPIESFIPNATIADKGKSAKTTSDLETNYQASEQLLSEDPDKVLTSQEIKLGALMTSTGSIHLKEELEAEEANTKMMTNGDIKTNKSSGIRNFCNNLFDVTVLRRPVPVFFVVCSILGFFGYFNFILFLPLFVSGKGVTRYDKALLVSICGIGDLIGRISSGVIGDLNIIERYKIKACSIILVGVTMLCFLAAHNFGSMAALSGFYGFFGGVFINYTSIVLIDFVGLKMMPKVLALVLLIQGIGAAAGQPLLGWIKDASGSYDIVIYVCGFFPIIGGGLLWLYPLVKKRDDPYE